MYSTRIKEIGEKSEDFPKPFETLMGGPFYAILAS